MNATSAEISPTAAAAEADPLLVETVDRLLADVCTPDEVERAELSGWSQGAWTAMAEAGFTSVGLPEGAGGSGGTMFDLAAILRAVGRYAAAVPIAETAMLGGWLLTETGLSLPDGPLSVAESASIDATGRLCLDGVVAWARQCERIVGVATRGDETLAFALRPDQVVITPGANLAGEARDRLTACVALTDVEHSATHLSVAELGRRGALSRVIMAAGALSAIAQMTVDYTNERRQFGKPVATFQAVQLHLVTVAQCAVRAQMAADIAVRAFASGQAAMEIAAARVIVDDAITQGTRAAHQAHGAMGVTREYPLHHLTRRLWSWRGEWGTTRRWRRDLGSFAITTGADDLFTTITR